MRHVDHRDARLPAQPQQLVEQPSLRDDIETGSRLVEDHHRRLADERDRDAHALLLASRELVRESTLKRLAPWKPDALERIRDRWRGIAVDRWALTISRIASPMRIEGLRDPAGFCGT